MVIYTVSVSVLIETVFSNDKSEHLFWVFNVCSYSNVACTSKTFCLGKKKQTCKYYCLISSKREKWFYQLAILQKNKSGL